MRERRCFFAGPDCDGPLDRAHWVPKQRIRREFGHLDKMQLDELVWHPAVWSWMCRHHHGNMDNRSLRVTREMVPIPAQRWAEMFGMQWSIERDFPEEG